jgi:hypothetical protein
VQSSIAFHVHSVMLNISSPFKMSLAQHHMKALHSEIMYYNGIIRLLSIDQVLFLHVTSGSLAGGWG